MQASFGGVDCASVCDNAPTLADAGAIVCRSQFSGVDMESTSEVSNLVADVQDLLSRLAHVADPEVARVRARVEQALATAKRALADGTDRVQRQAKNAVSVGDLYVRDNPWQAVGIAAAAGFVVGVLVARRASGPS
jgi:ElaB/YqjD/DUF883 family membrane-anchored ribosome-binding protein